MIHVLPINDEREHEESTTCWCNPRIETEGELLVIHNSADCRELIEQAEEIKNQKNTL